MKKCKHLLLLLFVFLSTAFIVSAQEKNLDDLFESYQIVELDVEFRKVKTELERTGGIFFMEIAAPGGAPWTLDLMPSRIIEGRPILRELTATGEIVHDEFPAIPMNGSIRDNPNSLVAITIGKESFIQGRIFDGKKTYYIQNLRDFDSNARSNQYVLYDVEGIKNREEVKCGAVTTEMKETYYEEGHLKNGPSNTCFTLNVAIANDATMLAGHGSVAAVTAATTAVFNNMAVNFDAEFEVFIEMRLVEVVVTNAATDPWSTTTDGSDLLGNFINWAPGGFVSNHDIGTLWTQRDLFNTTGIWWWQQTTNIAGIARFSAACQSDGYNVCEDITTNPDRSRLIQAHEIGHNVAASHDAAGTGFIMQPAVSNSNTWSAASKNDISNYLENANKCFPLANCSSIGQEDCDIVGLFKENCNTFFGGCDISQVKVTVEFDIGCNGSVDVQEQLTIFDENLNITTANGSCFSITNLVPGAVFNAGSFELPFDIELNCSSGACSALLSSNNVCITVNYEFVKRLPIGFSWTYQRRSNTIISDLGVCCTAGACINPDLLNTALATNNSFGILCFFSYDPNLTVTGVNVFSSGCAFSQFNFNGTHCVSFTDPNCSGTIQGWVQTNCGQSFFSQYVQCSNCWPWGFKGDDNQNAELNADIKIDQDKIVAVYNVMGQTLSLNELVPHQIYFFVVQNGNEVRTIKKFWNPTAGY